METSIFDIDGLPRIEARENEGVPGWHVRIRFEEDGEENKIVIDHTNGSDYVNIEKYFASGKAEVEKVRLE